MRNTRGFRNSTRIRCSISPDMTRSGSGYGRIRRVQWIYGWRRSGVRAGRSGARRLRCIKVRETGIPIRCRRRFSVTATILTMAGSMSTIFSRYAFFSPRYPVTRAAAPCISTGSRRSISPESRLTPRPRTFRPSHRPPIRSACHGLTTRIPRPGSASNGRPRATRSNWPARSCGMSRRLPRAPCLPARATGSGSAPATRREIPLRQTRLRWRREERRRRKPAAAMR